MTMNTRDPRPTAPPESDIRPVVAGRQGPMAAWLAAGAIILGAILLFNLLDGQRRARSAAPITFPATEGAASASPLPLLEIPPEPPAPPQPPAPQPPLLITQNQSDVAPMPPAPAPYQPPSPQALGEPASSASANWSPEPSPPSTPQTARTPSTAAALVIDVTLAAHGTSMTNEGQQSEAAPVEAGAIQTSRLVRRSSTVAQGTLIPAVLETALDSTRPGFARAIVSNDIRGFDGSRILIPRGSRLYGRYQADIAAGQKRAFVEWTRLVRPDGVSIAIASPAADAQGRAGVEGRVNSHFLQRFGSAVLQTTMAIGVSAASRSISGDPSVIVALPRSSQPATPSLPMSGIQPTLRVNAGTRVSVFVAQDMEFPGGDAR